MLRKMWLCLMGGRGRAEGTQGNRTPDGGSGPCLSPVLAADGVPGHTGEGPARLLPPVGEGRRHPRIQALQRTRALSQEHETCKYSRKHGDGNVRFFVKIRIFGGWPSSHRLCVQVRPVWRENTRSRAGSTGLARRPEAASCLPPERGCGP